MSVASTHRGFYGTANSGTGTVPVKFSTDSTAPQVGDWLIVVLIDTDPSTTTVTTTAPTTGTWVNLWTRQPMGTRSFSAWATRYTSAMGSQVTFTMNPGTSTTALALWGAGGNTDFTTWVKGTYQKAPSTANNQTALSIANGPGGLALALFGVASSTTGQTDAQNTVASPWVKGGWSGVDQPANPVNTAFFAEIYSSTGGTTPNAVYTHTGAASAANLGSVQLIIPDQVSAVPVAITAPASGATVTTHTPTISGTGDIGGSVAVSDSVAGALGTATVSGSGTWSLTPTASLANGSHTVTATQTPTAGSTSTATDTFTVTVASVTPLATHWYDGMVLTPVSAYYYDGTTLDGVGALTPVYKGRKVSQLFKGRRVPVVAHRAGSADWREHSLQGATQSAIAAVDVIEISVAMSSDGVLFGLHDAYLDRTSLNVSGGTTLPAATMTWAQIQAYTQKYPVGTDPVWGNVDEPYTKLSDFLDVYAKDHAFFIDPKNLTTSQRQTLYALLKTYPAPEDTFILKYFHTGTVVGDEARALGWQSWGYGYAGDVDGTNTPQMSVTQSHFTYLGMEYGATAADWATVLSYGKPVFAHITPTLAAANTGLGLGARGIMASGVNEVMAGIPDRFPILAQDDFMTAGDLSASAKWTTVENSGSAVVDGKGRMTLTSRSAGYVVNYVALTQHAAIADCQLSGTFELIDLTEQYITIGVRAPGTWPNYYPPGLAFVIAPANGGTEPKDDAQLVLMSGVSDGSYQNPLMQPQPITFPWQAGVPYSYKLEAAGELVRAKIWLSSAVEPDDWTLSAAGFGDWTSGVPFFEYTSGNTTNPGIIMGAPTFRAAEVPFITSALPTGYQKRNGTVWRPTYQQDFATSAALGTFTTTAPYSSMGFYSGFTDTSGQGLYSPDKVLSAHDSMMDVYLHIENGQPLVASVMPDNYAPHTTGRFDTRLKTDASAPGFKLVLMFWPNSDDWNQGEIDWPEADIGGTPRPASAIPGSAVRNADGSIASMSFAPGVDYDSAFDTTAWHLYSTEWNSTGIYFYVDEVLVLSITDTADIPTQPMRVTLQFETFDGEGTVPPGSAGGHIYVDHITIYDKLS